MSYVGRGERKRGGIVPIIALRPHLKSHLAVPSFLLPTTYQPEINISNILV